MIKLIALVLVGIAVLLMPVFIWFFGKMLFHYQRMIFGIKKSTYKKGYALLGPFLLADKRFFESEVHRDRVLFFSYLKKSVIIFVLLILSFTILHILKTI